MAELRTFAEVAEALGRDAIRTQERLDAAFLKAQAHVDNALAERPALADWLRAVAPERQLVRSTEARLSAVATLERTTTYALRLRPLNLGLQIVHGIRTEQASEWTLVVEQIPSPEPSPTRS